MNRNGPASPPVDYSHLVEYQPDGVLVLDDTRIIYANRAANHILGGAPHSKLIGSTIDSFIDEQARKTFVERLIAFGKDEAPYTLYEGAVVARSGSEFRAEIVSFAVEGEKGRQVCLIIKDIEAVFEYEKKLRISEESYRMLVDKVPAITYIKTIHDIASPIFVSPQITAMLGFTQHEFISEDGLWLRQIHIDDRQHVIEAIDTSIERDEPISLEYRIFSKDGRLHWYRDEGALLHQENGEKLFFQGIMIDVSRSKIEMAALEEQVELSRFSSELGKVLAHGGEYGAILAETAASLEMVTGVMLADIWVSDHSFDTMKAISSSGIIAGSDSFDERYRFEETKVKGVVREGRTFIQYDLLSEDSLDKGWVISRKLTTFICLPLMVETVAIGAVAIFARNTFSESTLTALSHAAGYIALDVKRRQIETELQTKNIELGNLNRSLEERVQTEIRARKDYEQGMIQKSKMADMGEMMAAIAHQWRQPLNALALIIQDVADAYRFAELTGGYIEKFISKSMDNIKYMSRTIDDFGNFFKPTKTVEPFDVKRSIEEIISMFMSQFKNQDIEIEVVSTGLGPIEIVGYANEFKQVILNLFNNAKDAIISQKMKKGADGGSIQVSIAHESGCVQVTVDDNGGGIPDGVLARIFDPYFSTKGETGGTGIGLSVCRTIIEKSMGGTITAENIGPGARISISIPDKI